MRVAIVEDSDSAYTVLAAVVRACPQACLAGRAVSEAEAVRLVETVRPDVLLLDLGLSPGSGVAVLRALRNAGSTAHVYVVTNEACDAVRTRCLQEGADGFFDKTGDLDGLRRRLQASADELARQPERPGPARGPGEAAEALSRITDAAAAATGCPLAAVTLLDSNRQWLVARTGTDMPTTSRRTSFCRFTVESGHYLEVPDLAEDPRFEGNPFLERPFGLRFYAGVPLRLAGGRVVGALCVLDQAPRRLDEAGRQALQALARDAAAELECLRDDVLVRALACDEALDGGAEPSSGLDPLTGLPGRAALLAAPAPIRPAALAVDLDAFTRVNHAFGRTAGDVALAAAAERIRGALPQPHVMARTGGDEFVVLLPDVADEDALVQLASRVAHAVAQPLESGGCTLRLRCTIGAALAAPDDGIEALLDRADVALLKAKHAGGGQCRLYAAWMGEYAADRLVLEADLRTAIARRALDLVFQPQVELATGRMTGLEALVRWKHPARGPLPPQAFIPLAEEAGLIGDLGALVLDMALEQLRAWRAEGLDPPQVAVNVSALQLTDDFSRTVEDALQRHGLEPECLELEITESALPHSDAVAHGLLSTLRNLRVSLAIDDFGTGYSSLGMLRKLPVNTLKIDRSLVVDLRPGGEGEPLVHAVLSVAASLGLRVVAEGVETAWLHERLTAMGCACGQGYFYGRPMPADAIAAALHAEPVAARSPAAVPAGLSPSCAEDANA